MADTYGIFRDPVYGGIFRRHAQPTIAQSARKLDITFNVGMTLTPAIARSSKHFRGLDAGATLTGQFTLFKKWQRTLAGSITLTPALSKRPNVLVAQSLVLTPAMPFTKKRFLTIGLALVDTPALVKLPNKFLNASGTLTPALNKGVHLLLADSLVLTGAMPLATTRFMTLNAEEVFACNFALSPHDKVTLATGLVLSPSQSRQANLFLGTALSLSGALGRVLHAYRTFDASQGFSVALTPLSLHKRSLAGGLSVQPALLRIQTHPIAVGVNFATAMSRFRARVFNYNMTLSASTNKRITVKLPAAATFSADLKRGGNQFIVLGTSVHFFNSVAISGNRIRRFSVPVIFTVEFLSEPVRFTRRPIPITKLVSARLPEKHLVRVKAR